MSTPNIGDFPTLDREDLQEFVELLNREQIEPCHIADVWEDFVYEKIINNL